MRSVRIRPLSGVSGLMRAYKSLSDATDTVRDRFFLPSTSITALSPLNTTFVTIHGPVHFSCTNFDPIPCRKSALSLSRARTRPPSATFTPAEGRDIPTLRRYGAASLSSWSFLSVSATSRMLGLRLSMKLLRPHVASLCHLSAEPTCQGWCAGYDRRGAGKGSWPRVVSAHNASRSGNVFVPPGRP